MTGTIFRAATAVAALQLVALPAAALFNDRVEVFAGENLTYDDNVFRISRHLDAQSITGEDRRGDSIRTTSLGASFDVPYSLQRFQAGYTWFSSRYGHFDYLNYDGYAARAAYLWSLTPEATGDVGYTDTQQLANFANLLGTTDRDLVRTQVAYGDALWFPVPSLRINLGTAEMRQTHDDPAQAFNDIETAAGLLAVGYVNARDDRLGLEARAERGRSPHDIDLVGTPVSNGYRQQSIGVVGRWVATGISTLDARVDWVRRQYDQPTVQDFNGPTVRITHTWTPSGKLTVASALYRDVAPLTAVQSSNFVIERGVSVKPRWEFTDKISVEGDAEYNNWEYRGNLATGENFTYRVRTFGATLSYRPTRRILLQCGYVNEMRTATIPNADYRDNLFNISARVGF
jgi:exopolysaccharide biosynthesis operon protein EpsL